jgi:hypothetical protein
LAAVNFVSGSYIRKWAVVLFEWTYATSTHKTTASSLQNIHIILSPIKGDYRWVMYWWMDLLATYT